MRWSMYRGGTSIDPHRIDIQPTNKGLSAMLKRRRYVFAGGPKDNVDAAFLHAHVDEI